MNPIENILKHQNIVILDGAMATELEKRGCDLNNSLWSAKILFEKPERIYDVHMDYLKAGADVITSASYQATYDGFIKRGMSMQQAHHLIQSSVELATQARDDFWAEPTNRQGRMKPLVAASIGPYGAFLEDGSEYRGGYLLNEQQLAEFHRPRMKALIDAGADILACETIPCLSEAKAIAKILAEFNDITAWISFSCKDAEHISDGECISTCAEVLDDFSNIVAIGVNCTSPVFISSLIQQIKGKTSKPIIVYPNLGEAYDPVLKKWIGNESAVNFSNNARKWYEIGASIIGGCCRTSPAEIHSISDWGRLTNS